MSLNNFISSAFGRKAISNSLDLILLPLDLSSLDKNQGQSFDLLTNFFEKNAIINNLLVSAFGRVSVLNLPSGQNFFLPSGQTQSDFVCGKIQTFLENTKPHEIFNNSIVIGMTSSWSFFDKQIELSNFFANGSFLFLFLSMACYWIDLAFFDTSKAKNVPTLEYAQTTGNSLVSNLPLEDSSLTNQGYHSGQARKSLELAPTGLLTSYNLGKVCLLLANISLILLLCIRWKESGHFPLSNLYESLMFLSLSCTSIHLFLIFKNSPKNLVKQPSGLNMVEQSQKQNLLVTNQLQKNFFGFLVNPSDKIEKLLGAVLAPLALFLNAFATFSLPKEMQLAGPLVPALQSNWLMMHVTVMIISYAALILGSLLSIVYIILIKVSPNSLTKQNQNQNIAFGKNPIANNTIINSGNVAKQNPIDNIKIKKIYTNLDYLSYRIIGIGFPFLTIGILSGAVWANEAWGSYWSWDPKETWALLTWLIFAIYLHTRLTKGWEGEKPALIAAFGFIVVWICYLGVNLLGEGLHSYGFFS